jgi:hypothetical protein
LSVPKILTIGAVTLFSLIAAVAYFKRPSPQDKRQPVSSEGKLEPLKETPVVSVTKKVEGDPVKREIHSSEPSQTTLATTRMQVQMPLQPAPQVIKDDFPIIDRVFQLFTTAPSKLPIVETIQYSSSVSWLKGRLAWVADYASHYGTSRHFIARSLNGKPDYFSQKVLEGSKFNVFRKDKQIQFYLLVDVSRLKMGFYYVDLNTNERVLLKTYSVGLGRLDPLKPSGTLTPLGRYSLGDKVAIYKPGMMSYFQDQKTEMIRVLGTRWIPFDQEIERTTAPAKGYGFYGAPWVLDPKAGSLVENRACIGGYDTDGGIRMLSEDLEELFAIVITKPTYVEIVKDFHEAKLPGIEVATPKF